MTPEDVQAMLREDRDEWEALKAVLDARPEGPLHDPESPEWTSRDVYTHLATMMEGSTKQLEAKLAGRPVPQPPSGLSEDEVNARIQQAHSDMSLAEARAWGQRAFDAMLRAIESVPLERWHGELEFYARADGSAHYRGHRRYVVAD
ncbi:MAG: maleylpyruvate isomerase N-terminal domain-containing protein [Dehalococcoidia bacterium]|nr:maleylpyruvate isomerase N-terminal domain-containing protein [Dehalococcoidia bacterium]